MQKIITYLFVALGFGQGAIADRIEKSNIEKPRLVLVLVIDQFRADYLTRFQSRFLPAKKNGQYGGFRFLMENGAYYPQAQHGVLQNMTCPGHAAILTGSYPYQNGIAINDWYDSEKHRNVYCVEDSNYLPVGAGVKDQHPGTSPQLLIGTTFGDELKNAGLKSKVISISLKDRAAILLGGHRADLALWLDSNSMRWISSTFYLRDGKLPSWVETLNQRLKAGKDLKFSWPAPAASSGRSSLLISPSKNSFHGDMATSSILSELGSSFPHSAKQGQEAALYLPYGVERTVDAAEMALEKNKLGHGDDPDLLAVSFSTHDFLGHFFGPNSREMEEMTVAEDQQLARLLNFVNKNVPGGLQNVLIVMTADHGVGANPEWLSERNVPAGRIDEKILRQEMEEMLTKKFGKPSAGSWITAVDDLNFYLNRAAAGGKLKEMEKAVVDLVSESPKWRGQIAAAFSESDVRVRLLPPGQYETQILRTFFKGRSGDVIVIPAPNFINGESTATHMSGYSYDRTVPILMAGKAIRPGRYSQAAQVIDLAPTLAFITGVIPPSNSEGRVLSEALQ